MAINSKRADIILKDVLNIAEAYAIKNPKGIISDVQKAIQSWDGITNQLDIPEKVVASIKREFKDLI